VRGRAIVALLSQNTCKSGIICWFEAHPGTAAWLQGAGTVIALAVAIGAYVRYRHEGFRPRLQAWCNPDGRRAVLLLTNLGRASGAVDDVLVGKRRSWLRWRSFKGGYSPSLRAHRNSQIPPCVIGPGESMRLLLIGRNSSFTQSSARVAVGLGIKVKTTRVKRLRRGLINEDQFTVSIRQGHQLTGSSDAEASARATWEATRQELLELSNLHSSGQLSIVDLWIGRYRSLRRAQRVGPPLRGNRDQLHMACAHVRLRNGLQQD
jgi:hypothetical protein